MTDFHTHTSFCDGADTPVQMAEAALQRGFSALGFSGHSYTDFDTSYCMSLSGTQEYIKEIRGLKTRYAGRMKIFCGLEQDYFAETPEGDFDYKIGSVHYLRLDGEYYPIDSSAEEFSALLGRFGGDYEALAETYFTLVGDVLEKTKADIIGHFDLITKFSERLNLHGGERYFAAASAAIRRLLPYGKPFEINVGAMTRGYRSHPYPASQLLREICRGGGEIILSGDCHDKNRLGDFLPEAAALAKACGFSHALRLAESGFERYAL